MKLYKRQIRPMIHIPADQGFFPIDSPIVNRDDWHNEDEEDFLFNKYEKIIKKKDAWATLKFDERFIPIKENDNPEEHEYVLGIIEKMEKIEQIYSDYLDNMDAEKLADKLGEVF